MKEGYTEPDPKIDLSGVDVARKILILSRESGLKMELEDISNQSFLSKESLESDSNEEFFEFLRRTSQNSGRSMKQQQKTMHS